jgi:hypothetical protein
MIKTWPVYFKHFVQKRTDDLDEKVLPFKRQWIRLQKEEEQAFQVLEQILEKNFGPEAREAFLNYENAVLSVEAYTRDYYYGKGLLDGLRLGRSIDRIRKKKKDE